MTHATYVTLEGVSLHLPDGRPLFSQLDLQLDQPRMALVGRNGVGKSLLARLIAGAILPTTGRCLRAGSVYYLSQYITEEPGCTVADLLRVTPVVQALERMEQGHYSPLDLDLIGDQWMLREHLLNALANARLSHLTLNTPVASLSGGEAMRVALLGAFASKADLLILDEPTNHLDACHRQLLSEQLDKWPKAVLVISHDRVLLESMQCIIELSSQGLIRYSGGYSSYAQAKDLQQKRAQQRLERAKVDQKREAQALRAQRENLERKQARGQKQASDSNQANILLGRQKQRSQLTHGKVLKQQDATHQMLATEVKTAALGVEEPHSIFIQPAKTRSNAPVRSAELIEARLPFAAADEDPLNLMLTRGQRIAVSGPNGCGKSTLLKVLAGHLPLISGVCTRFVHTAYLDQTLSSLSPRRSSLEQLQSLNPAIHQGELRTWLAQLGLGAHQIHLPCAQLSGGERLKAAMACVFYRAQAVSLLLLDEPTNHLDLASIQALEVMLKHYTGTLVIASHDHHFIRASEVTHTLKRIANGWRIAQS